MSGFPNSIDSDWTLFLDRDGVINRRIPGDYVKSVDQFVFEEGALDAVCSLSSLFTRVVVVTNQQGIAKGIMKEDDLDKIHAYMLDNIRLRGGRIDKIYHCPDLAGSGSHCRKPETGMAFQAKADFPEISFEKSLMIGDSESDMIFGQSLSMKCIFIGQSNLYPSFRSLAEAADWIRMQQGNR